VGNALPYGLCYRPEKEKSMGFENMRQFCKISEIAVRCKSKCDPFAGSRLMRATDAASGEKNPRHFVQCLIVGAIMLFD
jgi:hypothetical protein